MSEYQNARVTTETAGAAVAARPRISADAFRSLTARLKKSETTIPDLKAAAVQPLPTIVPIVMEPQPVEQVAHSNGPEHVEISPVAVEPIELALAPTPEVQANIEILPIDIEPLTSEIEAAPVEVEAVEIQPVDNEPLLEAVVPVIVQQDFTETPAPEVEAVEPVAVALEAIQIVPPDLESDVLPSNPEPDESITVEVFTEVTQHIPVEPLVVEAAAESYAFPLLPEIVVAAPETTEPEVNAPSGAAGFEENFTYLPESGKQEKPADLAAIDEAVKQGVAERAVQLELENIWRMLLAKPTSDDRATYLREAKEFHADDEEWNKPAPEYDLSRIEPAGVIETNEAAANEEATTGEISHSLVDNLPVAEGQDLTELTRSLLDMMAAGNASGLPQERALAADTLLRLVPRLEMKPLLMVAQRLAMMDNPPHLLVSRLIRDPRVEIAGPLLEDCPHIGDKELQQVVEGGEPDKLRLIARRRKLSRTISEALIKSGDPSVVLTLVRNMEAEISHDGFQSLIVLCENQEELLAPLATRQDLTAPFAFELFWLAPVQLRRFILSRFLTDSETLTKILKITMAANNEDDGEAEPLNQHTLLEALERAARGKIENAAEDLSTVMQISVATVTKILNDLQGDALVVMLKAAVYPRSSMLGLLKRMQSADLPLISRDRDLTELQAMFETLSFNKARILLTYWDWAQSKTGPYAAPH